MALIMSIVALALAGFSLLFSLVPCVGQFAKPYAYGAMVLAVLAEFLNLRTKIKSLTKFFVSVSNLFALIFAIFGCIFAHEWEEAADFFGKDLCLSFAGEGERVGKGIGNVMTEAFLKGAIVEPLTAIGEALSNSTNSVQSSDFRLPSDKSVKEMIQSWQSGRWKKDVIKTARNAKRSVSASDLAETCETAELQPAMDRLIADYASLVNGLDAYADASDEKAALKAFTSSISASDLDRTRDDSAKLNDALNGLREKASRSDDSRMKALNSDEKTVGRLVQSVEDMYGVARKLLAEPPQN